MITEGAGGRRCILLTGGRAPVTLELARLFHEAGHRVFVAESAPYHLCRVSKAVERCFAVPPPNRETDAFLESLERIIREVRIDVVIPTCEEIFYIAKGLSRLSRHCLVWAPTLDVLQKLHSKWTFIETARMFGLNVPRTELIRTREQWLSLGSGNQAGESLVLKPVYSRFASRVLVLNAAQQSAHDRQRLLERTASQVTDRAPWVAQRFVSGRDLCTYSVAYNGRLLAHAAYESSYRLDKGASVYFEPLQHEASRDWVRRFVEKLGFTGQIAFDFIETKDGTLYPLECNPRATSGIHLLSGSGQLDTAFLRPETVAVTGAVIEPNPESRAMLTMPMLLSGMRNIRTPRRLGHWWKSFRAGRDVVFHGDDQAPFWEQFRILYAAYRVSRRLGVPVVEATTYDIEWNGEA